MIFVTVGTTAFPFERLFQALNEFTATEFADEMIVQTGPVNYHFQNPMVKKYREVSFERVISLMRRADLIITHGGPTSIFLALKYGRHQPLVVPRSARFREHVDEHEACFAKFLRKRRLVEIALPQEKDLAKKIKDYWKNRRTVPNKPPLRPSPILLAELEKYLLTLK